MTEKQPVLSIVLPETPVIPRENTSDRTQHPDLKEGGCSVVLPSRSDKQKEKTMNTTDQTANEAQAKGPRVCDRADCTGRHYAKGRCRKHMLKRRRSPEGVALEDLGALGAGPYNELISVMAVTGRTPEQVLAQALALLSEARR